MEVGELQTGYCLLLKSKYSRPSNTPNRTAQVVETNSLRNIKTKNLGFLRPMILEKKLFFKLQDLAFDSSVAVMILN